MSGTDKVDRVALTELVAHRSRAAVGPSARNELEEVLVSVVAELLGLETVGIEENFFLLGGHSLLGAQLIARIGDRFGVEVSLRALFDNPTVADIAAEVERLLVADLDQMSDQEAELLAGGLAHGSA
jgi:acyl carrier protein